MKKILLFSILLVIPFLNFSQSNCSYTVNEGSYVNDSYEVDYGYYVDEGYYVYYNTSECCYTDTWFGCIDYGYYNCSGQCVN